MSIREQVLDRAYRRAVRPWLFGMNHGDPERAHEWMIHQLNRLGRVGPLKTVARGVAGRPRTPVEVAGISFPGRVGVAAGLDKNGDALRAWGSLGFGFAELGTVTAESQPGNVPPRLFRLPDSEALINRMGFNNRGAEMLVRRLQAAGVRRGNNAVGIPLGISIGKTKVVPVEAAIDDYLVSLRLLAPYADYVAVNVSSPNTPGLRSLQDGGALLDLVTALVGEAATRPAQHVPVFVKIAPDLTDGQLDEVLTVCADAGAGGIIAANTTLARDGLAITDLPLADEAGGLSGRPLTRRARQIVRLISEKSDLPVIGSGGIMSADDAQAMFDAGARLVQVYTGFIYRGPALVEAINALPASSALPAPDEGQRP